LNHSGSAYLSIDKFGIRNIRYVAALSEQWKAQPGWQFLTGDKASVEFALHRFGQAVENKESHSNIFIIGNEATGLCGPSKRLFSGRGEKTWISLLRDRTRLKDKT